MTQDHTSIERLLASYPRSRTQLSPAHRASYLDHYRANRSGEGLSSLVLKLEAWMHRRVCGKGGTLLEIGSGNWNHVPYENAAERYDAIEPFEELARHGSDGGRIHALYADIGEAPIDRRYDRIVSVAVLEHLTDLPLVLAEAGLRLAPGGEFRAGFPTEGGLLWGLAWRCTTGIAYRLRRRLDYRAIMRHEHVNRAKEIEALIEYFFEEVGVGRFPLPFHHLSFYSAVTARRPRVDRCAAFRASRRIAADQRV